MAQTQKEKALNVIAKQIKELDNNSILLDELKCSVHLGQAREHLYSMLEAHGMSLTKDYVVVQKGTTKL